jgi:hypothetical protein
MQGGSGTALLRAFPCFSSRGFGRSKSPRLCTSIHDIIHSIVSCQRGSLRANIPPLARWKQLVPPAVADGMNFFTGPDCEGNPEDS